MKQVSTVSVVIKGKAHDFIASRNTTCDDVINMAKRNVYFTSLEDDHKYAVFESSFGIAKKLSGNTKILKQIRSWGVNARVFEIRIDHVASKMASISRAKNTIKRLRTLMGKTELKEEHKSKFKPNTADMDMAFIDKDRTYTNNITFVRIAKYDLPTLSSNESLPSRSPGDGKEHATNVSSQTTLDICNVTMIDRVPLNTGFISDNESKYENSTSFESFDLNECLLFDNISRDDDVNGFEDDEYDRGSVTKLDTTFMETNRNTSELNECFIYDKEDFSTDEDESAFEDDSDCESISELDRNILEGQENNTAFKFDEIKEVFNKVKVNACLSEDELMESFMNTYIETGDSDEGVESDCSDLM